MVPYLVYLDVIGNLAGVHILCQPLVVGINHGGGSLHLLWSCRMHLHYPVICCLVRPLSRRCWDSTS